MPDDATPPPPDAAAARALLNSGAMARWIAPTVESRIEKVPRKSIHPRPWLGEDGPEDSALRPLRDSITARGIMEPLLLRSRPDGEFEVVTGARRLRVATDLGLAHVPAIVRDLDDAAAMMTAIWAVTSRRGLLAREKKELRRALVAAGVDAAEAASLLDISEAPEATLSVSTTAGPVHPMLAEILANRPPAPRFVGIAVTTAGLHPAARASLTALLSAIDPRQLVRPR